MPLAAALLALALAGPATGQESPPLVGDRPDFTESTETIPRGRLQLETGVTRSAADDAEEIAAGEVLLRIGLLSRLELRVLVGSYVSTSLPGAGPDPDGLADPAIGIKVKLTDGEGARPAVALLLGTSIPIGSDELSDDEAVPDAKLALAWQLTERWGLASNINYARAVAADGTGGVDRFDQGSWSLSGAVALGGPWGAYLEYFGISKEEPGGDAVHFFNAGVTYLVRDDLQLDGRVGRELEADDPGWFAGVGAVVRW